MNKKIMLAIWAIAVTITVFAVLTFVVRSYREQITFPQNVDSAELFQLHDEDNKLIKTINKNDAEKLLNALKNNLTKVGDEASIATFSLKFKLSGNTVVEVAIKGEPKEPSVSIYSSKDKKSATFIPDKGFVDILLSFLPK